MQFVGRTNGVRGINQYLDMQAILFEQITLCVTRCGLGNEEIGRATGQHGFPTGDAVVQEIARISDDGRAAIRIIATCAGRRETAELPSEEAVGSQETGGGRQLSVISSLFTENLPTSQFIIHNLEFIIPTSH